MQTTKTYTKLPGRGRRGTVAISTLWLGSDHLLMVDTTNFSDDYKRFYFKDIKAIIIRRTTKWSTVNWITGVIAFLLLASSAGTLAAHLAQRPHAGAMLLRPVGPMWACALAALWIGGFSLFLFLYNLLRGPTCACHFLTPVQLEHIVSMSRLRVARKVLRNILPLIEEAQGAILPEGLDEVGALIGRGETSSAQARQKIELVKLARVVGREETPPGFGDSTSSAFPPATPLLPPPSPSHKVTGGGILKWRLMFVCALTINAAIAAALSVTHRSLLALFLWVAILALGAVTILWRAHLVGGVSRRSASARVMLWGAWTLLHTGYWYAASFTYGLKHPGDVAGATKAFGELHGSFYAILPWGVALLGVWILVELLAMTGAFSPKPQS